MAIEIVFKESFDNVDAAVQATLTELGYTVKPSPMSEGTQVRAKMSFWLGEKGYPRLSMWPVFSWFFRCDTVSATISAYKDGTTGIAVKPNAATGGNAVGGLASVGGAALSFVPGGGIAGSLGKTAAQTAAGVGAQVADDKLKAGALGKALEEIDKKLRERLGAKIAYEGPAKPGVEQLPA